jgi:hypothetical protein
MTHQDGNTLIGYIDNGTGHPGNGTSDAGDDTQVFTLTVDPTAGSSGQYTFDLVTALDPTITDVPIGSGSSFGVGPSSEVVVTDSSTSQQLVYVTGWAPGGSFDATDPTTWDDASQRSDVNGSSAGWGLANNNFDGGEFLRFDFGTLNDYDGAGGYSPPSSYNIVEASYATFQFKNFSSGDHITFVAHYSDGSSETFALDGATAGGSLTIHAHAGSLIDWIDTYESAGSIKLNLTNVGVASSSIDETVPFSLHFVDGDGDTTATQNFTVHIADGLTPAIPAAPVVLDLDGNGLGFVDLSAGVTHDYGSGVVATAWAAADDGLLAHATAGGLDVVFSDDAAGAKTDLQGLALAYDSNHDGQLTSADAAWSSFGVWQDANSNGVVDPGEFKTLNQAGISAISLTTDGHTYSTADGDVTVLGTGSFTKTDGTTGVMGDTVFATAAQRIGQQTSELSAAAAALGGFLAVPLAHSEFQAAVPQPVAAKLADITLPDSGPTPIDTLHETHSVSPSTIDLTPQHTSDAPLASASSGGSHEILGPENATLPDVPHATVTTQQLPVQAVPMSEAAPVHMPHGSPDVALMNALLTMNHGPAHADHSETAGSHDGDITTQEMPKVAVVLHDALAGHTIDQIVDKFAGDHGPHNQASGKVSLQADGHTGTHSAEMTAHAAPAVLDLHVDANAAGHAAFFAAMAAMPIIEEHVMAHA